MAIEGDNWFWTDDNAKVLELLGMPSIWTEHPTEVADVLTFVRAMCDGPFIFRRIAAPRLVTTRNHGGSAEFIHSLMNVGCDLARGIVWLGMRFHDGRTVRNVVMTGNYVRFQHRGKVFTVDVEDGIRDHAVEVTDDGLKLLWRSEIEFETRRFGRQRQRLGALTYTCTIRASSMFVEVEAALDLDPAIEVSDLVLTLGYDDLSHGDNNVRYENIRVAFAHAPPLAFTAGDEPRFELAVEGATYWCVAQRSQISGFALAVHSLPGAGSPIHALKGTCQTPGQLHWLVSEYHFAGGHRGGRLVASERKIITAGGFYDEPGDYAAMLTRHARRAECGGAAIDLSISYDYGAEVKAFARCFRSLAGAAAPTAAPTLRDELRDTVDHFRGVYQTHFTRPFQRNASAIFSRSIAFMAFAYIDMVVATDSPVYRAALREACQIIMTFERQNEAVDGSPQSGFLMGQESDSLPYVDCHSSCLLALARATALLDEPAWLPSIDRGLAAFRLDTIGIFFLGMQKQDVAGVDFRLPDGSRRTLDMFWNFNAGLTLRLFNALRATRHGGLRAIWERHAARIETLEMLMHDRVAKSLRWRDGAVEILSSVLSAESNSETQPWVALALIGEESEG